MKIKKLFGIKKTKHSTYYRCYFLWLPYIKVKYVNNMTKVYLFGIQIACVNTICPSAAPVAPIIQRVVVTQDNREIVNQRAIEIIAKHQDSDYTKETI